ncbi:MAG: hypothetical protein RMJ33_02575 [Saprospiraceae bacterium]|nr:hypothetical protein [Saprospiraceae bacterium]MDW8228701.1 hypothetical protein [Saprospiraceae bacterium]
MNTHVLWLLFVLSLPSYALLAQGVPNVSEEYLLIRGIDGNVYMGRLLRMDSAEVVLQTVAFPELAIPRRSIKRMRQITAHQAKQTFIAEETTISGNYFFNGSAYGVRSGEIYYRTTMFVVQQGAIGFSNNFSIRGGGFIEFNYMPTWIAPKISFPIRRNLIQFALEGMLGRGFENFVNFPEKGNPSALQGLLTIGNRTNNLTLGGGFSWRQGQWSQRPFFSVSGTAQVSKRFGFIAENHSLVVYRYKSYYGAFGGRIYGRRVNLDLAVMVVVEANSEPYLFPLIGLGVNFY